MYDREYLFPSAFCLVSVFNFGVFVFRYFRLRTTWTRAGIRVPS